MKNSVLKRFRSVALLLMATVVLGSCNSISEDLPGCDIYIDFRYDYNMSGQDYFAAQCDKVELFAFDDQGILRFWNVESGTTLSDSSYRMRIPVEYGEYTVVALAGHKDSYDLSAMRVGTTTKEELTLRMQRNADGTRNSKLEPLWHGMTTFTYEGDAERTQTVSLVKNTNTLNLALSNVADTRNAAPENMLIKVTADNGSYNFDNSLRQDEQVTYLPYSVLATDASLSVLRLMEGERVSLSVIDKNTGVSLLPESELDLIMYLLLAKPSGMTDQEYLDRQNVWNIGVNYSADGFVVLSITVNGWVVWTQNTDL